MKEFNLEEAKAGKPVCTRDGRKARIIYWDAKCKYPIIALVEDDNGNEYSLNYSIYGKFIEEAFDNDDLMMVSEKQEGWMNIYRCPKNATGGIIYPTKEEAMMARLEGAVTTIHIEWEE